MKVLMFSWEYAPYVVGGLGKHVVELLPELAAAGVAVHLVTPAWAGGSPLEKLADDSGAAIIVHRIEPPAKEGDFFSDCRRTNERLAQAAQQLIDSEAEPFDLLHAHDWLVSFAAIQIKHRNRLPLVATIHATEHGRNNGSLNNPLQYAIHNAEWQLAYEAWRVIANTYYMKSQVEQIFACPSDKVEVIPNGVDTRRFDVLEGVDLRAFRLAYATPDEKIVFNVGRVVYEKGAGVLVDALPLVLNQFGRVKFVVAGTGGMLPQLRERVQQLGVADSIYFTGFISDDARDRLFKVADVAVFPSLYEPFGIVALEAMGARTPVVVSSTGGLAEVVEHGETGIWVYPNNPESLAWGIVHTLAHPEWAQARVANAYRVVKERYNWKIIATQTVALYERVAAERKVTSW